MREVKRRVFPESFKREAVDRVVTSGPSAGAVARELGLAPHRLTRASGMDLYWTPAQMIAHHTTNGCDLRAGDLLGTGTVSSPSPNGNGSLLELTSGGKNPIQLESDEVRTFLQEGDEISFSGWCEREGFARIGFGKACGRVVANAGAAA